MGLLKMIFIKAWSCLEKILWLWNCDLFLLWIIYVVCYIMMMTAILYQLYFINIF